MNGATMGASRNTLGRTVDRLEDRTVPAVYTVTTLNDAGAGSLRQAVIQANANAGADTIQFAVSGILSLTGGEINIRDAVSILGTGVQSLQIDAGGQSRIFNIDNGSGTTFDVLLQGMRLSNGTADFFNTSVTDGGIIYNGERLTVSFCELDGGGNSGFFDNGGAIYSAVNSRLSVQDSLLHNNGNGGDGGGIYAVNAAVTILRSEIYSNTTSFGADGAGMFLSGAGTTCSVIDSYFHDNNSAGEGGGIATQSAQLNVSRSLFTNNTTTQTFFAVGTGGAIRYLGGTGTIQDSTFVGNRAIDYGGAIEVNSGGSVTIINCTITGNVSDSDSDSFGAGAVDTTDQFSGRGPGSVFLANNVIAQNQEGRFDASFADLFGAYNSGSFNNFIGQIPSTGETTGLTNGFFGNTVGSINGAAVPFLGNLQNNGGRYPSIVALPGSPLIGTGSASVSSGLDQRGFVRVGAPDIGATDSDAINPSPTPNPNPTPTPGNTGITPISSAVAVGAGVGGLPQVNLYGSDGTLVGAFLAYERGFRGGVKVARADVDGDGTLDIITVPGEGGAPLVKVFSGKDASLIRVFYAFPPLFRGGLNVAAGDVDGDGKAEIAVGIASGAPPIVQIYSGATGTAVNAFFAYFNRFLGGVNLAMADTTGDGRAELITTPGAGAAPEVKVFNPLTGVVLSDFLAVGRQFIGGAFVSAGDLDGDGKAEIVVSLASGPPLVTVYNSATFQPTAQFFAYNVDRAGGVRVTVSTNSAGSPRILTTPGKNVGGAPIRQFTAAGVRDGQTVPFAQDFIGGAFVG